MEVSIVSREKYVSAFDFILKAWIRKNYNDPKRNMSIYLLLGVIIVGGLIYGYSTPTFKLKIILAIVLLFGIAFIPFMLWHQKLSIENGQVTIMLWGIRIKSFDFVDICYIKKSDRFDSAFELRMNNHKREYFFWNKVPDIFKSYEREP